MVENNQKGMLSMQNMSATFFCIFSTLLTQSLSSSVFSLHLNNDNAYPFSSTNISHHSHFMAIDWFDVKIVQCSPNAGPFVNICHSSGYDCLQSGKSITVNCVSVPLNTDQSIVQNCWKFTLCTYPEVLVKCVFQDIRHLPIWPPLTHRPQYGASLSNRSILLLTYFSS